MSDRWPVRRTWSTFSFSPTYWMAHRSALNQVHHVTHSTIRGGFHAKLHTSCSATKRNAHFYTDACFTAWMFTQTVPLVRLFIVFLNAALTRSFLRLGGQRYGTSGKFGSVSLKLGDRSIVHWWSQRMHIRWGRSGWKVTTSGVTSSLSFFVHGSSDCSRDIVVAFSIPCATFSPTWACSGADTGFVKGGGAQKARSKIDIITIFITHSLISLLLVGWMD